MSNSFDLIERLYALASSLRSIAPEAAHTCQEAALALNGIPYTLSNMELYSLTDNEVVLATVQFKERKQRLSCPPFKMVHR